MGLPLQNTLGLGSPPARVRQNGAISSREAPHAIWLHHHLRARRGRIPRLFERAFGLAPRFLHESGTYGELDTGTTTLAFADHALGHANFPGGHVAAHSSDKPLGMEIAFVTPMFPQPTNKRCATVPELAARRPGPWGQTVSYVRCPDGTLVELCTPILAG